MQSIKFHNFCKKLFHINEVDISLAIHYETYLFENAPRKVF